MKDGAVYSNAAGSEYLRRIWVENGDLKDNQTFFGAYLEAAHVAKTISALKDKIKTLPFDLRPKAKALLTAVQDASHAKKDLVVVTNSQTVPNGIENAVQEEWAHAGLNRSGFIEALRNDADLTQAVLEQPSIIDSADTVTKGYGKMSDHNLLDEVFAKTFRDDAEAALDISAERRAENEGVLFDIADLAEIDLDTLANELENVSSRGKEFAENARLRKRRHSEIDGEHEPRRAREGSRLSADLQKIREDRINQNERNPDGQANRISRLQPTGLLRPYRPGDGKTALANKDNPTGVNFFNQLSPLDKQLVERRFSNANKQLAAREIRLARTETKGTLQKVGTTALDILSAPRSLKSSVDLSAPLRQGGILTIAEPKLAVKAFVRQVQSLRLKNFNYFKQQLDLHPDIELAEQSKLFLSTLAGDQSLNNREEAFMSRLFGEEKLFDNKIGEGVRRALTLHVRASERAYTTYLDSIRMDAFSKFSKAIHEYNLRKNRPDDPEQYMQIARFINIATGRGELGSFENAAPILNTVFWSPRNLASRIQLLNPMFYKNLPPGVRKIALIKMLTFFGLTALTMLLLKRAGGTIGTNPNDPDFLKVRFGDFHYDLGAGFVQPSRLVGQLVQDAIGKDRGRKEADTVLRFGRSKLSPGVGSAINIYTGKDFVGQPANLKTEILGSFDPMIRKDTAEAIQSDPHLGAIKILPSVFGVGVGVYDPKKR